MTKGETEAEPKLQRRTLATRRKIMDAAIEEFADKGFDGGSLREIARKAQVRDGLIHYHFGGKEALWKAVAHELFNEMHQESDAAAEAARPTDELAEVRVRTRDLLSFYVRRPELNALISQESQRRSPRMGFLMETFLDDRFEAALAGIEKAQAVGDLPSGDPRLIYVVITSLATALVQRAGEIEHLTDRPVQDPELQEEFWAVIDQLIFQRRN